MKFSRLLSIFTLLFLLSGATAFGQCTATYSQSASGPTISFASTITGFTFPYYFWDFGDGNYAYSANPSHTYSSNGLFVACLTVMDSLGSNCTVTFCDSVGVSGASTSCTAGFSSSGSGSTLSFSNSSTGSYTNVWWSFGDGGSSTSSNPSHTYASGGTYNVCLTIWNNTSNCSDTLCQSVTVVGASNCAASFTHSMSSNTFSGVNTSTGGYTSLWWDFGDNTFGYNNSVSHTYANQGWYMVCLYIQDSSSNCFDSYCDTVYAPGGSTSSCAASFNQSVSGSTASFTNTSTGSYTNMNWTFGDGSSGAGSNPSHTYTTSGVYLVCLTISDSSSSCYDVYCDSVLINASNPPCNAYFIHFPDTTGQYGIIAINQSTGNNLTYAWTFGDGGSSTSPYPQHTYANAGTYMVCLTVSNNQCTATYCDTITVTQKVAGTLTINVISPTTAIAGPVEAGPEVQVYPNPFTGTFNIGLELIQSEDVTAELFDIAGKSAGIVHQGSLPAGVSEIEYSSQNITPGIYFLRVSTRNNLSVVKLIKTR